MVSDIGKPILSCQALIGAVVPNGHHYFLQESWQVHDELLMKDAGPTMGLFQAPPAILQMGTEAECVRLASPTWRTRGMVVNAAASLTPSSGLLLPSPAQSCLPHTLPMPQNCTAATQ